MRAIAILLLLGCSAIASHAGSIPRQLLHARYVAVVMDGGGSRGETHEERQAIVQLENRLRDWGRYIVTMSPANADIIFAVRLGQTSVQVGMRVPTSGSDPRNAPPDASVPSGQTSTAPQLITRAKVNPGGDALLVYPNSTSLATPLWMKQRPDGLAQPLMPLFESFKQEVNEAEVKLASESGWKDAAKDIRKKVAALGKPSKMPKQRVKQLAEEITTAIQQDEQARLRVVKGDMTDVERLFREKTAASDGARGSGH